MGGYDISTEKRRVPSFFRDRFQPFIVNSFNDGKFILIRNSIGTNTFIETERPYSLYRLFHRLMWLP